MKIRAFVLAGLALAAVLALVVAPHASSEPDGLERVAIDEGFASAARAHALDGAPTAGYEGLASGVLGVAVCFVLAGGAVLLLRRRRS